MADPSGQRRTYCGQTIYLHRKRYGICPFESAGSTRSRPARRASSSASGLWARLQGEEFLLGPGNVVVIDEGEEHWHGAAPGGAGEHLAINLGEVTTWLESSEGEGA